MRWGFEWPRAHLGWLLVVALITAVILAELGVRTPHNRAQSQRALIQFGSDSGAPGIIERIRSQPARVLGKAPDRAIVEGVAFGRTDNVTAPDQQAFLDSGLWHLLAASGQNIALVVMLCVGVAVVCGAGRATGMMLALGAIPSYVLLVGGGASIIRAGIMGMISVGAWLVGREFALRWSLISAAAILCWWFPGVHRGLGFQLSCACVASLLMWGSVMSRWLGDRGMPRIFAAGASATILCTLCTAPVLFIRTGTAPALGGVANLVAVPLASLVLVIGLPASIVGAIWPQAGELLLPMAGWCAAGLRSIAHIAAVIPGAQTSHPMIAVGVPASVLAWWSAGRVFVHMHTEGTPRHGGLANHMVMRSRSLRVVSVCGALGVVALGTIVLPDRVQRLQSPASGTIRITFLDVGQGMATLIQTPSTTVLLDTGPAGVPVARMLHNMNVRKLDGVILSHNSADHRAGLHLVMQRLHPDWVVGPAHTAGVWNALHSNVRVSDACAGDTIRLDRSTLLRILNPPCGQHWSSVTGDVHNDNAMVVMVEHHNARVLLPADCEAPILGRLGIGRVDVIAVPHHGSADPDLSHLLDTAQPSAAVISVGAHNRYGHPHPATLAELRSRSIPIWRTDQVQAIAVTSDLHGLHMVSGLRLA